MISSLPVPYTSAHADGVVIYAVHRTERWWKHVGENLGYGRSTVLTDRRGKGDRWLTDDFYAGLSRYLKSGVDGSERLNPVEVADVIARCRFLRWLPKSKATAMALSMADAVDDVLASERPRLVLSFPIDSYITDLLARRARARGIPYYELTAGILPRMCMLLHRGALAQVNEEPDPALVRSSIASLVDPLFAPSYVAGRSRFNLKNFLKVFAYFQVRGYAFKAYSHLVRDPLNLHYSDAQSFLGHKVRWRDRRVIGMVQHDWRERIEAFPKAMRVFFGLQLFPEASIDYWINDLSLVDYENAMVLAAEAMSRAGYVLLVKDHPLQFGFRQTEFLDRLMAIPNVVLLPYEVSGNALLSEVGVNLTLTGTLGMQAALAGLTSVTTDTYYTTDQDFLTCGNATALADAATRLTSPELDDEARAARRVRIVSHLLKGSFDGDYFSFKGFNSAAPAPAATSLAHELGLRLRSLEQTLAAQRRIRPDDDHPGSPFERPWSSVDQDAEGVRIGS